MIIYLGKCETIQKTIENNKEIKINWIRGIMKFWNWQANYQRRSLLKKKIEQLKIVLNKDIENIIKLRNNINLQK